MPTALFAFPDRQAASRAAVQLDRAGFVSAAVQVHYHDNHPNAALVDTLDEQLTGGFVHNFAGLLQGLFDGNPSPTLAAERAAFEQAVQTGGAVLSIDVTSDDEQRRADEVLADAGAARRSDWLS